MDRLVTPRGHHPVLIAVFLVIALCGIRAEASRVTKLYVTGDYSARRLSL